MGAGAGNPSLCSSPTGADDLCVGTAQGEGGATRAPAAHGRRRHTSPLQGTGCTAPPEAQGG
eukprot:scaffold29075_cov60-Phaeocystis_antarctica.AAC.1